MEVGKGRVSSSLGLGKGLLGQAGHQAGSLTKAGAVDHPHSLLYSLQDGLVSFQDLEANADRVQGCSAGRGA